jgi:DNA mismatch endonuclease (patch repair protein)
MALPRRMRAMTDRFAPEQRSRMMAAVRGKDTAPELYVRKHLFAAGFRFRLHVADLPGKPDILLPRYRVAVFVHGCFWHGHNCRRGVRPSSNTAFWDAKLDANIRRDRRARAALKAAGWRPIVIWQCALEMASSGLVRQLQAERAASAARG